MQASTFKVVGGDPALNFENVATCATEAEAVAAAIAFVSRKGAGFAAAFGDRAFVNRGGAVREVASNGRVVRTIEVSL